ncbi:MAG TPA: VOC family protein [Planctomycetaceae bacterium]|nr:VOC family protein [Planctomycetaceae bacterium]
MSQVQPIPAGYHSVTPYLIIKNAAEALEFYKRAFGATEKLRLEGPGGTIMHAEVMIGDSHVMLGEQNEDMGFLGPKAIGGTPVSLLIYVENVDQLFAQAVKAGAKELQPVTDQFYGDRSGRIEDPFGHLWSIATHIEDLTQEEIDRRFADIMQQGAES